MITTWEMGVCDVDERIGHRWKTSVARDGPSRCEDAVNGVARAVCVGSVVGGDIGRSRGKTVITQDLLLGPAAADCCLGTEKTPLPCSGSIRGEEKGASVRTRERCRGSVWLAIAFDIGRDDRTWDGMEYVRYLALLGRYRRGLYS